MLYVVKLFSGYFVPELFAFTFMLLMWQMKRSVNMVSSSVLFMFVKKQENLRVTIYKKEIICA